MGIDTPSGPLNPTGNGERKVEDEKVVRLPRRERAQGVIRIVDERLHEQEGKVLEFRRNVRIESAAEQLEQFIREFIDALDLNIGKKYCEGEIDDEFNRYVELRRATKETLNPMLKIREEHRKNPQSLEILNMFESAVKDLRNELQEALPLLT